MGDKQCSVCGHITPVQLPVGVQSKMVCVERETVRDAEDILIGTEEELWLDDRCRFCGSTKMIGHKSWCAGATMELIAAKLRAVLDKNGEG